MFPFPYTWTVAFSQGHNFPHKLLPWWLLFFHTPRTSELGSKVAIFVLPSSGLFFCYQNTLFYWSHATGCYTCLQLFVALGFKSFIHFLSSTGFCYLFFPRCCPIFGRWQQPQGQPNNWPLSFLTLISSNLLQHLSHQHRFPDSTRDLVIIWKCPSPKSSNWNTWLCDYYIFFIWKSLCLLQPFLYNFIDLSNLSPYQIWILWSILFQ